MEGEEAVHGALAAVAREAGAAELRDAKRAALVATHARSLDLAATLREERSRATRDERRRFADVRDDMRKRAARAKAALKRKQHADAKTADAEAGARIHLASEKLRADARVAEAKRVAADYADDAPADDVGGDLLAPASRRSLAHLRAGLGVDLDVPGVPELGAPRPAKAADVDELLADKTDDFFPDLDDALDAPETADYAADVAAESGDDALLRDFADSSEPKDLDLGELDAVLARARGALVPDLDGEDEIAEGP